MSRRSHRAAARESRRAHLDLESSASAVDDGRSESTSDSSQETRQVGTAYPRSRSRRSVAPREPLPDPGWRASKRSSKLGKQVRKEAKSAERKERIDAGVRSARSTLLGIVQITGIVLLSLVGIALVGLLLATGINEGARWLATREAQQEATPEAQAERARENLLIIGRSETGGADFLAVRLDRDNEQLLGIAIPSGAFMEVPGQGFERVGDSFAAGPGVSMAAVSNYLTIAFEHYVVVDQQVYQDALTNQSLRDLIGNVGETDLGAAELADVSTFIASVPGARTALVPLPVKPLELGGQTYFEPQRDQIADLLLQWWDVRLGADDGAVRIIVYNGVGTPGIAGVVAQALIAQGMRVVDTRNADRFDYDRTLIVVQDGDLMQGEQVKEVLGVGDVVDQPSEQDVADVIVIIGKDYVPPKQ